MTEIGSIYLDLTIKDSVSKQLETFKNNIQTKFKDAGDVLQTAIEEPVKAAAATAKTVLSEAVNAAKDEAKEAEAELKALAKAAVAESRPKRSEEIKDSGYTYTPEPIKMTFDIDMSDTDEDFVKFGDDVRGYVDSYAEKLKSGLKTASEAANQTKEAMQSALNFEVSVNPIERLEQELENTDEKIGITKVKLASMDAALQSSKTDEEAAKITEKMNALEAQLINLTNRRDKISLELNTDDAESVLAEFFAAFKTGFSDIGGFIKKVFSGITGTIKTVFNNAKNAALKAFNTIKSAGSKAFNTLKSVGGKAIDSVRSKFTLLKKSGNGISTPVDKFLNSIKRAARSTFLMAGIYAAFRGIKSAVSAACEENEEFASTLGEIKANLSLAFTPIMNTVMPYINALMSGIAALTKQVAAFMNELFGSSYAQALAAKKAAQKAANEAETANKAYLASFDEISKVEDDSDDDSDSDDSSIDYSALDPNVTLPDWAEQLKTAIKNGDWSGVGSILSERVNSVINGVDWYALGGKLSSGINTAFEFLDGLVTSFDWAGLGSAVSDGLNGFADGIDWDIIQKTVKDAASGFASGINSFVKGVKWKNVGKAVGNGLNTAFGGIYTFFSEIDWKAIGRSIGDLLGGAVDSADWELVGKALASKINAAVDTAYSFVSAFDWSKFGRSIAAAVNSWFSSANLVGAAESFSAAIQGVIDTAYEFVTNFDWTEVGQTLGESVNAMFAGIDFAKAAATLSAAVEGIFDTVTAFLETVDWENIGEQVWTFLKSIDWKGIITKLFKTIGRLNRVQTLFGSLVSLLWGFIKDAVASIGDYFSEKIEECGGSIFFGLCKGIKDAFSGIFTWIKENIFEPFIEGFKNCFGIHSPSTVMSEQGGYIMKGLLEGITSKVSDVISAFKGLLSDIKDIFKAVPDWFKEKFGAALTKIKEAFSLSAVKKHFSDIYTGIKNTFSTIKATLPVYFSAAWTNVKSVFSLSSVKEHFTNIKNKIVEIFGSIADALKAPLNAVIDVINSLIGKLNSFSIDVPDWVTELTGVSAFGFNIPEIPHLASGGLVTAPTLAMVGDNANAASDPEAILPISKLQSMLDSGKLSEMCELLLSIDFTFYGSVDKNVLFTMIRQMAGEYKRRTGQEAF